MSGLGTIIILGMTPGELRPAPGGEADLAEAHLVVGGLRLLKAVEPFIPSQAEVVPFVGPLGPVIEHIRRVADRDGRVVVLADGDPLFFGIGRRLVADLGPERLRFKPVITTLQAAAAALRLPWDRAITVSLHGRKDYVPLFAALTRAPLVAVYTDATNSPDAIGRALLDRGVEGWSLTVLEDLGTPEEQIRTLALSETTAMEFSPLNLVLLRREAEPELRLGFGMADDAFVHENGLLTKGPVRAAGLARLGVRAESVVWDLGSGSGACAIEAAALADHGAVAAVERVPERAAMVRENIRRCGAWNVEVAEGELPGCLDALPDPDRIFIGGGLGKPEAARDLLAQACDRLAPGGRLVAHCILLSSLETARAHFAALGWEYDIIQLTAASSDPLAGDLRFKGHNPVFILAAHKPR